MSPLKIWLHHLPQKRTPTKFTKKLAAFRTLAREAVAGRYEQEAIHKARVETNRPRVQRWIIREHIIGGQEQGTNGIVGYMGKNRSVVAWGDWG